MIQQLSGQIPLLVAFVVGAAIGTAGVRILLRTRIQTVRREATSESQIEIVRLRERVSLTEKQVSERQRRISECETLTEKVRDQLREATSARAQLQERADRVPELEDQVTSLQEEQQRLKTENATIGTILTEERKQNAEKLALLEKAKQQLSDAFKVLAKSIFEETTEQNKKTLGAILKPLETELQDFQQKIHNVHVEETKQRTELKSELVQLRSLNKQLSEDAENLTHALKGSSKTQGNWGELILERVLEACGLEKGREYELRETYSYENGKRGQPDVIINLPESRHLIIDAKVSLKDYEQYVNATTEDIRDNAMKRHLDSMRKHVSDLYERNYPALEGLHSLNLVLMFVPIESAFSEAIREAGGLWQEAFEKNVLIVSPTNLLFVLRTVRYLWQQEDQARNVREIAKAGGDLYDKFVGFVEDMQKIGERLEKANEAYGNASKKLSTGNGNLIRKAERLRELGIMPSKSLPAELVDVAGEESVSLPIAATVDETTSGNGSSNGSL